MFSKFILFSLPSVQIQIEDKLSDKMAAAVAPGHSHYQHRGPMRLGEILLKLMDIKAYIVLAFVTQVSVIHMSS